jgi:hypothetical protein
MSYHDLSKNTLVMDGRPITTPSGFIETYREDRYAQDVDYIEKRFAQLETDANRIIEEIDRSIEKGKVTLERGEMNTLRKFLFIISYRNGHRSQQFVEERFDKAALQRVKEFQTEHRLRDIRSVWFFNLKNLLESEHWKVARDPKIFFADRLDYKVEQDWFHLQLFCTPTGSDFVFTGAMGLSEGSPIEDPILMLTLDTMFGESRVWTGVQSDTSGTLNLSRSWPLTPRLLVILLINNSGLVHEQPSPNENPPERPYDIQKSYFYDLPKTANDIMCNPPLSPATIHMLNAPIATFTQKHHWLRQEFEEMNKLDGKEIDTRVRDLLTFQISELTEEQCVRVNVLLLDHGDVNIVFITAKSLQRALKRYMREGRIRSRADRGVSFQILEQRLAAEEKRSS